jgi:FkbM family methyltransferase
MDKLTFVRSISKLAGILQRLGLHRVTRPGKHILKLFLKLNSDLSVKFDGLFMTGSMEHCGYLLTLREGRREAFMTDLFKRVVKPRMVVLDIGAFLGQYTLLAAQEVGSNGQVYAFEPDVRNFSFLCRNIQRNGFSDRIIAVPKAVSDTVGATSFFLHGEPSQSSLFASKDTVKRTVVECFAIDEFLARSVIVDVIKIDIEGGELFALKGMEQTIAHASDELIMFVECNPSALRSTGSSAEALAAGLRKLGFIVMLIDEQRRSLSPIGSDIEVLAMKSPKHYVNLFCSRKNLIEV